MAPRTRKTGRRPHPAAIASRVASQIDELRAQAARLGVRLAGEGNLTATLPATRCTPDERERAEEMATAAGISLTEHIRRRASAPG